MTQENMDLHMQQCIRLCWECRDTCQDTLFNHALEHGGDYVTASHIRLMTDCMECCQTAADFMRRRSPFHMAMCAVCAEVCAACALSCETLANENAAIAHCAETCRHCAESCHAMSNMKQAA